MVIDDHHAVLELGGQVEGEAGAGQTRLRGRHPDQHVVHDVFAVGANGLMKLYGTGGSCKRKKKYIKKYLTMFFLR